ncbi:MAG: dienelactone hydrolase family protein [Woeseia sp.]
MTPRSRLIEYRDGDTRLEAYMAWGEASAPRPVVLIVHAYGGRGEYECGRADMLARMGYVGVALDVYGKGVLGQDPAECGRLMQPFIEDRGHLLRRLELGLEAARAQPECDPGRVAAIGYCFGGLCVLDMARAGLDLHGVVSFHGLFDPPSDRASNDIRAKVLVLHGWEDAMVPPDSVLALASELTARNTNWQIHAYGGTFHAFTNPHADDIGRSVKFDAVADRRSWETLENFLAELFE